MKSWKNQLSILLQFGFFLRNNSYQNQDRAKTQAKKKINIFYSSFTRQKQKPKPRFGQKLGKLISPYLFNFNFHRKYSQPNRDLAKSWKNNVFKTFFLATILIGKGNCPTQKDNINNIKPRLFQYFTNLKSNMNTTKPIFFQYLANTTQIPNSTLPIQCQYQTAIEIILNQYLPNTIPIQKAI